MNRNHSGGAQAGGSEIDQVRPAARRDSAELTVWKPDLQGNSEAGLFNAELVVQRSVLPQGLTLVPHQAKSGGVAVQSRCCSSETRHPVKV